MAESNTKAKVVREVIAVLLAVAALPLLYCMVQDESLVNPLKYNPDTQFAIIRGGFESYCKAFGAIIMLVGAAWLLVGYNDKLSTDPNRLTEDDEF